MNPYIGEIRMTAFDYAPKFWLTCNGMELNIREFNELYEVIGTTYGGDGKETFRLPDLSGRVPIHYGQGEGLSNYPMNQVTGSEFATLHTNTGKPAEGAVYTNETETGLINIQPALAVNFIIATFGAKHYK
ncbi:phage tail protein [Mucilaginibacter sp.]|jgi:microcystin-dependent protein|uniref:phage tail protein n=1 Tax=Mucilaginibacter sp. TaxID=1882438 RepID=UPI0026154AB1|nr:tail fiber protein [Mucilaginibacter sp.]MDB5126740.1 phage tail protein [Mucilaginibacter sp.]